MRRALRPRLPASLRGRLTAWVAVVLLASAGLILLVVYADTGTELRAQVDRDIAGDAAQMSQALGLLQRDPSLSVVANAASRYVRAQPYSATARLLFVLVPGRPAASNQPELFSLSRAHDGETLAEQSAENAENAAARHLLQPRLGYSIQRVADVGAVRVLERVVRVGRHQVVVGAGEPLALVERAQHSVGRAFLLAGAVAVALALLISYLAGARVSAPLGRLAAVAQRVDAGDLQPRMPASGPAGSELAVLAESFNHMLDRLSHAFAGQRAFVADASHELRTPLTVIRGQLEVLAANPQPSAAELQRVDRLVQAEVTRMSRLVEDLLLLAQAEQTDFLRTEDVPLPGYVQELWDGITLLAQRRFELGEVPVGHLRADPDRLAQSLRNLARNAIEHTRPHTGLVRLEVSPRPRGLICFAVVDDGPGIPLPERERVFERLHRADPARTRSIGGAGLGLAIVRAIAIAHGGSVRIADSGAAGGTRVELVLPGFMSAA